MEHRGAWGSSMVSTFHDRELQEWRRRKSEDGDRKEWFPLWLLSVLWGNYPLYKGGACLIQTLPLALMKKGVHSFYFQRNVSHKNIKNKASVTVVCVSLTVLTVGAALASLMVSGDVTRSSHSTLCIYAQPCKLQLSVIPSKITSDFCQLYMDNYDSIDLASWSRPWKILI